MRFSKANFLNERTSPSNEAAQLEFSPQKISAHVILLGSQECMQMPGPNQILTTKSYSNNAMHIFHNSIV